MNKNRNRQIKIGIVDKTHRQKCESPPSSFEDLKLKNDADLPEFMPPKSVRFKRDY
jgi:hypothetical protein